jgi:hypothetical protein
VTYNPEAAKQYRTREPADKIKDRKARFVTLNDFVTARHGWLVSIPGDEVVRLETLEGSTLPDELAQLGYQLHPDAPGERILPVAIVENIPVTAGSTATRAVAHAGVCRTERYTFSIE